MKRPMSGDLHRLTYPMSPLNPVETWDMSSLVKFPMSRRQPIILPRTNVVKLLRAIQSGPLFQSFGPPTLIVIVGAGVVNKRKMPARLCLKGTEVVSFHSRITKIALSIFAVFLILQIGNHHRLASVVITMKI